MTDKDKLAEEILKHRLGVDDLSNAPYYPTFYEEVIDFMQAYHEAKLAEITDKDIDVHIIEHYVLSSVPFCLGFTNGAKAFRDGLIKHLEA